MTYYGMDPEQQLRDLQIMEGVRERARAAIDSAWHPDAAKRAATIARAAPWMAPGVVLSLSQGTTTMEPVKAAAIVSAVRRARIKPTNWPSGRTVNSATLNPGDRALFGREREQAYDEFVAAQPGGLAPGTLIGREREAIGAAAAPEVRNAQRLGILTGEGALTVPSSKRRYDSDAGKWDYDVEDDQAKWEAFDAVTAYLATADPDEYGRFIPVIQNDRQALYSVRSRIITEAPQDLDADAGIAGLVLDALPMGLGEGLSQTIGNRRLPDPLGTRHMGATGGVTPAGFQSPKDIAQHGFMALSLPAQELNGLIRAASGRGLSSWQPQSDYLIALTEGMDPGDGIFVDPDSAVAQERKRRERNMGARINGEVLTIGRGVAGGLSHLRVIEPDSTAYRWVSGLADAAVAIYADPTALGAGRAARVSEARHLFAGGDDVAQSVGAIRGMFTKGVDRPTALSFLSSPEGTTIRENVAQLTNGGEIWRHMGRRLTPAEVRELRAASTPEAVGDVLTNHIGSTYRRTDDIWHEPSRLLKPIVESRWLTDMPASYINLSDEAEILPQTERWLRNLRAPEDKVLDFLDKMVTVGGDDLDAQLATLDVVEEMIEWSLRHVGFKNANVRRRVASRWRADTEAAREVLLEQITGGPVLNEMTLGDDVVPIGNPFDQYQHTAQIISLPDPRQLRRVASDFNRLIARGDDEAALGRMGNALEWWQEEIWKPFTLLRGAWPVRVIPEEQFRMAGVGHASFFKDTASYVVWALSRKRDALGNPWDEVEEYRNAATMGSYAYDDAGALASGRQVRIPKGSERYMDAVALNLVELHTDEIANLVARSHSLDAAEGWLRGTTTTTGAASTDKLRALAASFGIRGRSGMDRDGLVKALQGVDPTALPTTQLRHLAATLGIKGRTKMRVDELADAVRGEWAQLGARNIPGDGADVLARWKKKYPQLAKDPSALRTYLEMTARHIKFKTGDNPELLDAVRSGMLRGKAITDQDGLAISKDLTRLLERYYDELPNFAIGQQLINYGGKREGFVRWAFANLMGKPTTFLSRHPEFKQSYWQRYEEGISFLRADQHAAAIQGARDELLVGPFGKRAVKRMEGTAAVGDWTLEELDHWAKGYALDHVMELLYDTTKKSQIADSMRLVSPFGEAWREVVTRWATLLNPTTGQGVKNLRRAQQGITAARGPDFGEAMGLPEQWDPEKEEWYQPGFFSNDEFGEEVFIYPGSQWVMSQDMRLPDWIPGVGGASMRLPEWLPEPFGSMGTPGIPVPLTGRVQGLNMLGSVFPGLGPAASVPVSWFLPDKPGLSRTLREYMLPFGAVTEQGSAAILDMVNFAPPWMRTALTSVLGGGYDDRSDRIWANSVMATANYLYSTGRYDTTSTSGQQQLLHDAQEASENMFLIRSLVAFGAPAPPSPEFMVETNEGLIRLAVLRDDYYRRLADDPTTADEEFLAEWGDILAKPGKDMVGMTMQSFTREVQGGIMPTQEFDDWARANTDLERDYSAIWAFFGPMGGKFDYDVYQRQIFSGERQQLDPDLWMQFGMNHLGMMKKDLAERMMPVNPGDEHRDWMAEVDAYLYETYPGYGDPSDRVGRADFKIVEFQINKAIEDPRITETSAGQALVSYWSARAQVMEQAQEAGYRSIGQAKALEPSRLWLYEGGKRLAEQDEGFKALWNRYLRNEVEPDEEKE